MRIEELAEYTSSLGEFLTKISFDVEITEDRYAVVVCTKETYVFEDEDDADKKINEARQDAGFLEAKKKFKQGKINKAGEITRPDTYTVVIKLNH